MTYLAPAGTPISAADLRHWLRNIAKATTEISQFRLKLLQRFQLENCEFVSSGRAGLTLLLQLLYSLRGDPQRNEVLIPGYTCYSVPGSIEKAGLKIRVCDIDPDSLSYDLEQLQGIDFSKTLAIVSANLYGIPNNLPVIEAIAREKEVYFIDDAAQALGATIGGQSVGTFGDAGLYSLDKGKNITALQGGILVTRSPMIGKAIAEAVNELPRSSNITTLSYATKLILYAALLHPTYYGWVRKLPFLGLGKTPYEATFPVSTLSPVLGVMAHILFQRLETITASRRSNGKALHEALIDLSGIRVVTPPGDSVPVYLRFPFLLEDPEKRRNLLQKLDAIGVGATASYPAAVVDIPEAQEHLVCGMPDTPASRSVASRIVTLPTHPYVTPQHVLRIRDAIVPLFT